MAKYQLLPPLSADERSALIASISKYGVSTPIVVDDKGEVIDGHHRLEIANALGKECPRKIVFKLTEAEKFDLSLSLNADRRQMVLSLEQRREMVKRSLVAQPELSDRQHAERAKLSPSTVAPLRAEMVKSGEVSNMDTRVGANGVAQPASKPPVVKVTESDTHKIVTEVPAPPVRPGHIDANGEIDRRSEILADYIANAPDDGSGLELAIWRKKFGEALRSTKALLAYTAEEVLANADEDDLEDLRRRAQLLNDLVRKVDQPNPLRLVGGN